MKVIPELLLSLFMSAGITAEEAAVKMVEEGPLTEEPIILPDGRVLISLLDKWPMTGKELPPKSEKHEQVEDTEEKARLIESNRYFAPLPEHPLQSVNLKPDPVEEVPVEEPSPPHRLIIEDWDPEEQIDPYARLDMALAQQKAQTMNWDPNNPPNVQLWK